MIIETDKFSLFWGDLSLMVPVKDLENFRHGKPLAGAPWDAIRSQMPTFERFFFAHQIHGGGGHLVTQGLIQKNAPWTIAGDYLITNTPGIGIGVLTADCLPIMVYDPVTHACAAVHAGWRSSVAGIIGNAIAHMNEAFGSHPDNLKLFFGPCAGRCCYEVGGQLVDALGRDAQSVIETRGDARYFDLADFNKLQAIRAGVNPNSIDTSACQCTICHAQFCSWRRERERAGRQLSLMCLKSA